MKRLCFVVALAFLVACSKKDGDAKKKSEPQLPKLTKELVPDHGNGLLVGAATEDDVKKAYPDAAWSKDKSLGGDMVVAFNDHKGEHFTTHKDDAPKGTPYVEGYIVDTGNGLHLAMYAVHEDGVCDFVKTKIAKLDGAKDCPGNRKTGDLGVEQYFCLSTGDAVVGVDCYQGRELTYSLSLE